MASIYDLYMAEQEPDAAEQAAAMQEAVRGKRGAALVAALSGNPRLEGVAKSFDQQALQGEKSLADAGYRRRDDARNDARQRAESERWNAQTAAQAARQEAEAQRWHEQAARDQQRLTIDQQRAQRDAQDVWGDTNVPGFQRNRRTGEVRQFVDPSVAAAARAKAGGGAGGKPLPVKEANDMQAREQRLTALEQARRDFDDSYAGQGLMGPVKDMASSLLGASGTKGMQKHDVFWANWQKLLDMPERHEFFGSALTPTEKAAWDAARLVRSSKDPQVVRDAIENLIRVTDMEHKNRLNGRKASGYNPSEMDWFTNGRYSKEPQVPGEPPQQPQVPAKKRQQGKDGRWYTNDGSGWEPEGG